MDSLDRDAAAVSPAHHVKKTLHSKRSFGKYPKPVDSPAYDASEEDNDPLTDDAASAVSIPVIRHSNSSNTRPYSKPSRSKHHLAASLLSDDGVDSPTYDGDIESSTTAGPDIPFSPKSNFAPSHYQHTSSTSTLGAPITHVAALSAVTTSGVEAFPPSPAVRSSSYPVFISQAVRVSEGPVSPAAFSPECIAAFVQKVIDGEISRSYKINSPPVGRPVRVYADGVYDLFHFGHALQLRQAKLSFPSVYLLVGVCSDDLVKTQKARSIMTHEERCEAARHCRWTDEVISEAPWVITAEFLDKWKIDYVAHDEDPYEAPGQEDIYAFVKSQGKFLPTRRTPGISTSELLERIISGYRNHHFDEKFVKMGHAELRAEGSDYDERSLSGRSLSPVH